MGRPGTRRSPQLTHLNLARDYRGGEKQTALLIEELARRGWRQQLIGRAESALPARLEGVEGLTITRVNGRMAAAARTAAPLIHAHGARAAQAAWLASRLRRRPYILTRRVMNRPSDSRFTERVYRDAVGVCVVSRAVGRVLNERFPDLAATVVPDGWGEEPLDAARSAAIRNGSASRILVGTISAIERSKGLFVLADAGRHLSVSHPDLRMLLVGGGRDEPAIRRLAESTGNLRLTGFVDNVRDHLCAMDIFVLPTLREALGSVLLEAMACGLAIVASDTGGVPEIVTDDETGLLVPPGDAVALAKAIGRLAEDERLRRRIGAAARRAAEHYRADRMADHYEAVYAHARDGRQERRRLQVFR